MHESIILVLPSPTGIAHNSAVILHVYGATYDPPRSPLAYAMHHTILAMAISCKGEHSLRLVHSARIIWTSGVRVA